MPLGTFLVSGLALLAALVFGAGAKRLHLPKVTGYLVAGLVMGPSVSGVLANGDLKALQVVERLALGFVMFGLGREFRTAVFRALGRRVLVTTCVIAATTWTVTVAALLAAGVGPRAAVLFGLIAATTSPTAVVLIVRDYESSGPLTRMLLAVVGLGSVLALVLFDLALALMSGEPGGVLMTLGGLAASVLTGVVLGLILAAAERVIPSVAELVVVTLGLLLVVIGLGGPGRPYGFDPLIAAIVLGAAYANASTRDAQLFDRLRRLDMPLYCLLFVMAGAAVHFDAVRSAGLLVALAIVVRIAAIVIGGRLGARLAQQQRDVRLHLGWTLLPMGGVAIALMHAPGLAAFGGDLERQVVTLTLASVAFFELIGPLAVKFALVRVGEVKLINLVAEHGGLQALRAAVAQVRRALGIPGYRRLPLGDVTARHVMRAHVETLKQDALMPEILHVVAHSTYDLFPVVDEDGRLVGGIYLSDIRDLVFDPMTATLVIARDLASFNFPVIYEEDALHEVMGKFASQPGELANLPVVSAQDHTHLVGMVNQREVLDAVHRVERLRQKRAAKGGSTHGV